MRLDTHAVRGPQVGEALRSRAGFNSVKITAATMQRLFICPIFSTLSQLLTFLFRAVGSPSYRPALCEPSRWGRGGGVAQIKV